MKNLLKNMKKNYLYGIMAVLLIACAVLGGISYRNKYEYTLAVENQYNMAFYELIDYIQNVGNYLTKATISSTPEHGAETLTNVWREANLASVYLAQLPVSSSELSATSKFLNQVSDYSYSLSRKNINGEALSQEDLDNLKKLYDYSIELRNILEQLMMDMQEGRISWKELTKQTNTPFAQQVDNLSSASFGNIDQNFGEYEGLIYDGAFSEHLESAEKKGLTGEDIDEEKAKEIAKNFVGQEKVKEIVSNGLIENGDIASFDFSIKFNDENNQNPLNISISKKGGHVILMNYNRNVEFEVITREDANKIGKEFLSNHNFPNMEPTYYIQEGGVMTINYAYKQDDVIIYPDLIKLKVALDDGEILGVETSGYLNSHYERTLTSPKITKEEAKTKLNKNLEITSEGLAIIPTKWKTEVFCYEFKGKINNTDFLVYINADSGKEENILVIINTPNGILTE